MRTVVLGIVKRYELRELNESMWRVLAFMTQDGNKYLIVVLSLSNELRCLLPFCSSPPFEFDEVLIFHYGACFIVMFQSLDNFRQYRKPMPFRFMVAINRLTYLETHAIPILCLISSQIYSMRFVLTNLLHSHVPRENTY